MIRKIQGLIICFLLLVIPLFNVIGNMNNDALAYDGTLQKNDNKTVTVGFESYFLEKQTEQKHYSCPVKYVQRMENLIKKIRLLNTYRDLFSNSTYENIHEKLVENIITELEAIGISPKINMRWRLLELFHYFTKIIFSKQFRTSKLTSQGFDDFLLNINCKLIMFGRLVDVPYEPEDLMGTKVPWYFRYREHLKSGVLITYDGLLKDNSIYGDFLMTGRWFRGFYINIGFSDNYLDFTLGWTAYVMARHL